MSKYKVCLTPKSNLDLDMKLLELLEYHYKENIAIKI